MMRELSTTVVKVSGSLYDWPALGAKLRAYLASLDAHNVLLVPGGGATVDAIRALDCVHLLGEEESHWLALEALSVNARFLQRLAPDARIIADVNEPGFAILDPAPFFRADEGRPNHLPHAWNVTSDSLAARVAALAEARELILLKSAAWAGPDWDAASRAGVVDAYFNDALKQAPAEMHVGVINLRSWA
jgi:5-(aminomethyl)-3-furanmethanol phosphate kinase